MRIFRYRSLALGLLVIAGGSWQGRGQTPAPPLTEININTSQAHSVTVAGGITSIVAGGADIWNNADQFVYDYFAVTGDFDYRLKVISIDPTDAAVAINAWAKCGIMARESTAAGSRQIFNCVTPATGNNFYSPQWRDTTDGASGNDGVNQPAAVFPASWLRLRRQGSVFYYYWSADGLAWTQHSTHDSASSSSGPLPQALLLGIAVTSHDAAATVTAQVSDFSETIAIAVAITTQPAATVTAQINTPVSFTVVATGDPILYQWRKDGTDIAGATGATYTIPLVKTSDAGTYTVKVYNKANNVISANSVLTTQADATPPTLVSADPNGNPVKVKVVFSEPVDAATATNKANYQINNGVSISGATLFAPDTVMLSLSTSLAPGKDYRLTVNNVKDTASPANTIAANATSDFKLAGMVEVKFFDNTTGGTGTADITTYSSRLSGDASRTLWVTSFETPTWENGDNYLGQIEGYLVPSVTDSYLFAVASDDSSVLYLSTDDKPANKVQIATVNNNWTNQREFTKFPEQTSTPIDLVAGKKYYLQVLWAEGGGGDGASVTWQSASTGAGIANNDPAITGDYLLPLKTAGDLVITNQPKSLTVQEGQTATLSLGSDGVDGSPPYYFQWYKDGVAVPGATSPAYTRQPALLADSGSYTCVVSNLMSTVTSSAAVLTVTKDTIAPYIMMAHNVDVPAVQFTVSFSEPVDPTTATNLTNYGFKTQAGSAVALTGIALAANGADVILTAASLAVGTEYQLTVSNVKDRAFTPNVMTNATVGVYPQYVSGFFVWQVYDNAGFAASAASLTQLETTFNTLVPTRTLVFPSADTPAWEYGDNYGSLGQGWINPAETGDYIFHIASDDMSQLFLSTDDKPANLGTDPICQITGWDNHLDWTSSANTGNDQNPQTGNLSNPITLTKGKKYYFRVFQVEGGGGDGVSLGWEVPSTAGTIDVIPGSALLTLANVDASTVTITDQPKSITTVQNRPVTFNVTATGSSELGNAVGYQWQMNGADIAGANSASYTIPLAALTDSGAKFKCVVSVPGKSVASSEATLTVTSDTTPPKAVLACNPQNSPYLDVVYDKVVDPESATNTANYSVTGGSVTNAILSPLANTDHSTVLLYVSGIASANATLTINGIKDMAGNTITNAAVPVKTPLYAVNFESGPNGNVANAPPVDGYASDIGLVYGDRGNGLTYGWDVDNTVNARWRQNLTVSPDIRYDTFTHVMKPLPAGRIWNLAVPNGTYDVYVVLGEANNIDEVLAITIEGVRTASGIPSAATHWTDGMATVTVTDGKLTVTNYKEAASQAAALSDDGSWNNKIAFIEVFPGTAPAAKPKLSATRSAANLVISWTTAEGAGFTLYSADAVASPMNGTVETTAVVPNGDQSTVTIPMSAAKKFYYLKK